MAELLRMEGITKQFGAVYANKDINLSIEEGVSAYFRYDLVKRQKGKDRFTKNSGKTGDRNGASAFYAGGCHDSI